MEGNPRRVKEDVAIASYLMLVQMLHVECEVSQHVLAAAALKCKGRRSDDALQSSSHGEGTKKSIERKCKFKKSF